MERLLSHGNFTSVSHIMTNVPRLWSFLVFLPPSCLYSPDLEQLNAHAELAELFLVYGTFAPHDRTSHPSIVFCFAQVAHCSPGCDHSTYDDLLEAKPFGLAKRIEELLKSEEGAFYATGR